MSVGSQPASAADRRRVLSNAGALGASQVANLVFPLLGLAYLVPTLGLETYSTVAVGTAFLMVAAVITDFGFGVSAPAAIATARDEIGTVATMTTEMLAAKLGLGVLCGAALAAFALFHPSADGHREYFVLLTVAVVATSLQAPWFFHGHQRLGVITVATTASRASYLLLLLLLVRDEDDVTRVAIAVGLSSVLATAVSLTLMFHLAYRPVAVRLTALRSRTAAALPYFWSRLASIGYTAGGVIYLGLVGAHASAATLAIGQQFYGASQAVSQATVQAAYPHMARTRDFSFLRRLTLVLLLFSATVAVAGWVLVGPLLGWAPLADFRPAEPVLRIYLLALVVVSVSAVLGYPYFVAVGRPELANRTVTVGGVLFLAVLGLLSVLDVTDARVVAGLVLATESFILAARLVLIARLRRAARTPRPARR